MRRCFFLLLGVVVLGGAALADGVRPVTVKVKEQEAGRFLVQWRVPKLLPVRLIPAPRLPEDCRSSGDRSVTEDPGSWSLRQAYRCPAGLSGKSIEIDYPSVNVTVSTILNVELASGEEYVHMLAPGEHTWQLPKAGGSDARTRWREAKAAVLAGAEHFPRHGAHVVFLLSLLLLGRSGVSLRLATLFTGGQLVAIALLSTVGIRMPPLFAEIGVAVAAALLAREALRREEERKQLAALALVAGFAHGLGLAGIVAQPMASGGASILDLVLAALGFDGAQLLAILAGSLLGRLVLRRLARNPFPAVAVYLVAGGALALALTPAPPSQTAEERTRPRTPDLEIPEGPTGGLASRRVAGRIPDAALQSFVAVDAFEVRHEVLVRPAALADELDLGASPVIPIERQEEVKRRVRDFVAKRTGLKADGEALEPTAERVDFLTVDAQGALPRLPPVPEPVEEAWVGVTAVYLTERTPREIALSWPGLEAGASIPATVTDPKTSRSAQLTAGNPVLLWKNELAEDPAPLVTETVVEAVTWWVPLLSLLPFAALPFFLVRAARGRRRTQSLALARALLIAGLLLGPLGGFAWAVPFSIGSVPDPGRTRRILAGVLPNVYRAFEFPTESAVYDRLALSVTGDTLTEIYLEHRQAVTMEERGGARARVEFVEVVDVGSVEAASGDGFVAEAAWTVGGNVTHFGHRHFRQNRYDARVAVVPVEGVWKIRSIEVLDEKRLR